MLHGWQLLPAHVQPYFLATGQGFSQCTWSSAVDAETVALVMCVFAVCVVAVLGRLGMHVLGWYVRPCYPSSWLSAPALVLGIKAKAGRTELEGLLLAVSNLMGLLG